MCRASNASIADDATHMSVMLAVVGPRRGCRAYLRVLKLGQRLDRIFRRTGKHQFAIDEIELLNRNGHVVMRHPQKLVCGDDCERYRLVGCHDNVMNDTDALTLLVEDRL